MIRRVQPTAIAPLPSGSQPRGRTGSGAAATAALAGGAVFAVCVAVVYATRSDGYWIADCGNKALVAERLLDTRYRDSSFDYPAGRFDPERRWFPIPPPFALSRGDRFVSIFALAYAALAAPPLALLGPRGLRLPAALGAAASAALFVVWVAPALGRRLALAGALLLVLASPVFFYGVTVWEHSLTVALVLASAVLISRDRAARWAGAGALVGAACWLREDLALWGDLGTGRSRPGPSACSASSCPLPAGSAGDGEFPGHGWCSPLRFPDRRVAPGVHSDDLRPAPPRTRPAQRSFSGRC